MSRRRRRVREAGPVRKTVEVVVSALFGMAVVGVVLLVLQGGSSPAAGGPNPGSSAGGQDGGQAGAVSGLDGGLGIHSAAPGTPSPAGTIVYSAVPAPGASTTEPGQAASAAQASGTLRPANSPTAAGGDTASTGSGSGASATAGASSGATPSPSSTADPGLLGGLVGGVGGLVGGVLGLL